LEDCFNQVDEGEGNHNSHTDSPSYFIGVVADTFFEFGVVFFVLYFIELCDELVDHFTLEAYVYPDAHGIVDGYDSKGSSNCKGRPCDVIVVADNDDERSYKSAVCTREMTRCKGIIPVKAVFEGKSSEFQSLCACEDNNWHKEQFVGDDQCNHMINIIAYSHWLLFTRNGMLIVSRLIK